MKTFKVVYTRIIDGEHKDDVVEKFIYECENGLIDSEAVIAEEMDE